MFGSSTQICKCVYFQELIYRFLLIPPHNERMRELQQLEELLYPSYLLTVRKSQVLDVVSPSDLHFQILYLKLKLPDLKVINCHYEIDPIYSQLHAHLIVRSTNPIYFKDNCAHDGYFFHWVPLYTRTELHRAQVYVSKGYYMYERRRPCTECLSRTA